MGVGKATVARVAKRMVPNKENLPLDRFKKLSTIDKYTIICQINAGRAENAVKVTKNLNTILPNPVSTQIVCNTLKKNNLKAYIKKKKPLLTMYHRKLQLEFTLKYKEWTVENWKQVLWSDETKINCFSSDGRNWVWKEKGQPLTVTQKIVSMFA